MENQIACPKCGGAAKTSGAVSCWCDKDFCTGQRCGANDLKKEYACTNPDCMSTGTTPEAENYYARHMPKD